MSRFGTGNKWCFDSEHQPKKGATLKKTIKEVGTLFQLPIDYVEHVAYDDNAPSIIRGVAHLIVANEYERAVKLYSDLKQTLEISTCETKI